MNKDIIDGNWKQFKGSVQKQWGKLTNDELDVIEGSRMKLVGKIQEKYGRTRDEVEREVEDFYKRNNAA